MRRAWPWFAVAAALVAVDQVTKWLVEGAFAPGERLAVSGFFNLVLVYNRGAAFSFLAGAAGWQRPLLVAIALVAGAIVSVLLVRHPGRTLMNAGLAAILGGALGNVIDRLRLGQVVDFLDFYALGWHWPAFNLADVALTVGAGLLILDGFRHKEPRREARA